MLEAFANNLSGVTVDHGGSVSANMWLCGLELPRLDDPPVFPARRITHQLREARVPKCLRLASRSRVAKQFSELPSGQFALICRESRSHRRANGFTNGINWSAFPQPCWRFRLREFKASGHSEHRLLLIPLLLFLFSGWNPHTGPDTHSYMRMHTHM